MQSLSGNVFAIALSLIFGFQALSSSQSTTPPEWETLQPEGEEFTVLMPKGSTFESSKEPYHKI